MSEDHRSPLERFRSFPRKPLSVSDLSSGAWCELQQWYTLTKLPGGRRVRTPAMQKGSDYHQKLEDEVHTTVKVDVLSQEESFALRLWNLIQGLRTLREKGLTRELEVWGMVDGNWVNGVIDGLSHKNPNPDYEEELSSQESQLEAKQAAITDYFPPKKKKSSEGRPAPKVYLSDVKTRGNMTPVSASLLRPAKIQLLLYHRLLSDMAAGRLNLLQLFGRYGLDPDQLFSDAFLAQMDSLQEDDDFFDAPSSPIGSDEGGGSVAVRLPGAWEPQMTAREECQARVGDAGSSCHTLRDLVPLVEAELKRAFPEGENSLGHMLRVQYIHRPDGRELDLHDFPVSRQALDAYLRSYMGWWRGEREAEGVVIEEAFKCRSCHFVADCSWRRTMDEHHLKAVQKKITGWRKSFDESYDDDG